MSKMTMAARIAALEQQLQLANDQLSEAYRDQAYACLTRIGLERRAQVRSTELDTVIFMDLDEMHAANEAYGYAAVDAKIAASIQIDGSVIVGRWYSGDELVFIWHHADAWGLARRVLAQLREHGLCATFGIATWTDNLADAVTRAARLVQQAKQEQRRGTING